MPSFPRPIDVDVAPLPDHVLAQAIDDLGDVIRAVGWNIGGELLHLEEKMEADGVPTHWAYIRPIQIQAVGNPQEIKYFRYYLRGKLQKQSLEFVVYGQLVKSWFEKTYHWVIPSVFKLPNHNWSLREFIEENDKEKKRMELKEKERVEEEERKEQLRRQELHEQRLCQRHLKKLIGILDSDEETEEKEESDEEESDEEESGEEDSDEEESGEEQSGEEDDSDEEDGKQEDDEQQHEEQEDDDQDANDQ